MVPPACQLVIDSIAAGRDARLVWSNEVGGHTFAIDRTFVKWSPFELERERIRLAWAAPVIPVPRVIDHGRDAGGTWFVTEALPGESAIAPRWRADPRTAVIAIATGLRTLHDTLPVEHCPFSWSATERAASAERRRDSLAKMRDEHEALGIAELLRRAAAPPPLDKLVVCHGDPCSPNTLIGDDGRCSGHVDLGALGVGDRWGDLAVASWSLAWNYGAGWDDLFFATYGVAPDPTRIAYYRMLWDLGP
jgi:kanamycin kinase